MVLLAYIIALISDDNIARRLVGDGKIRGLGIIYFLVGGRIKDLQIALVMNPSGLTNLFF